jgi:O-antigen ligase
VDQALMFIEQSPLLGWGLGAFRRLWPLVRGNDQAARFDEVHSTLVEFVLELGLPAAVLLLFAFAAMAATFLNALLLRRRSRLFAVFGLALLALALLHSVLDFTLQMPANAVTLLALLGLAYGRALPIDATGEGGGRRIRDAGR